jgi:hypothetical protein
MSGTSHILVALASARRLHFRPAMQKTSWVVLVIASSLLAGCDRPQLPAAYGEGYGASADRTTVLLDKFEFTGLLPKGRTVALNDRVYSAIWFSCIPCQPFKIDTHQYEESSPFLVRKEYQRDRTLVFNAGKGAQLRSLTYSLSNDSRTQLVYGWPTEMKIIGYVVEGADDESGKQAGEVGRGTYRADAAFDAHFGSAEVLRIRLAASAGCKVRYSVLAFGPQPWLVPLEADDDDETVWWVANHKRAKLDHIGVIPYVAAGKDCKVTVFTQ